MPRKPHRDADTGEPRAFDLSGLAMYAVTRTAVRSMGRADAHGVATNDDFMNHDGALGRSRTLPTRQHRPVEPGRTSNSFRPVALADRPNRSPSARRARLDDELPRPTGPHAAASAPPAPSPVRAAADTHCLSRRPVSAASTDVSVRL